MSRLLSSTLSARLRRLLPSLQHKLNKVPLRMVALGKAERRRENDVDGIHRGCRRCVKVRIWRLWKRPDGQPRQQCRGTSTVSSGKLVGFRLSMS